MQLLKIVAAINTTYELLYITSHVLLFGGCCVEDPLPNYRCFTESRNIGHYNGQFGVLW